MSANTHGFGTLRAGIVMVFLGAASACSPAAPAQGGIEEPEPVVEPAADAGGEPGEVEPADDAGGEPGEEPGPETTQRPILRLAAVFAATTGADIAAVRRSLFVPFAAGTESFGMVAGTWTEGEATRSAAFLVAPCDDGPDGLCAGPQMDLGTAERIAGGNVFDLYGSAGTFVTTPPHDAPPPDPSGMRHPAVVLLVSGATPEGAQSTDTVILSLANPDLPLLLRHTSTFSQPGGGGLETIDRQLVRTDPDSPLDVVFTGTAMPGPGDEPMRPGPPVHDVYRFVDGTYRHVGQ